MVCNNTVQAAPGKYRYVLQKAVNEHDLIWGSCLCKADHKISFRYTPVLGQAKQCSHGNVQNVEKEVFYFDTVLFWITVISCL